MGSLGCVCRNRLAALFIVGMIVANAVAVTHTSAEELTAYTDPHTAHVDMLLHSVATMMGFLGIVRAIALNRVLQFERPSVSATVGMTFGVLGFAVLMAMLIVQGSVQSGIGGQFAELTSDTDRTGA